MSIKDEGFCTWLHNTVDKFISLSNCQRNEALDTLINASGAEQLTHLADVLPSLIYRDFLVLLPQEIRYHVLKFLDGKSLIRCSQVSPKWNHIINSASKVWWEKMLAIGSVDILYCSKDTSKYIHLYRQITRLFRYCSTKRCIDTRKLTSHESRVMAISYKNGKIASGSDDHTVKIWDAHTGRLLHSINTHTVCDLWFDDKQVYTSSFDCTNACWNIASGSMRHQLVGHTSAIFSIDVADDHSMILTGSSDKSVKLWSLAALQPVLVTTLQHYHREWVTKVKFLTTNGETNYKENVTFASVDKQSCFIWRQISEGEIGRIHTLHSKQGSQYTNFLHHKSDSFALCTWSDSELNTYITIYSFSDDNMIQLQNIKLGPNIPLRAQLLGVGKKFAVLTGSADIDALYVYNLILEKCVTKIPIPPCRSTRNGASLTLGNKEWLNGLDGTIPTGTLFAACPQNDNVCLVLNWKS
ncbi:F-box/WD repeat-containing protein 2 isoform X1 [Patella vulgata]|uniref:F-box/WD repeat-containing protein 2 isoform X1 n=1 Tax=Patella vulgata TaxID=6465 RepID=UPI00217FE09F|nr:F-box/WD repeat-containing protein 2 isoform X1 [Patella vulgata]XP_050401682.1 F-box/WD repeat-containing protein 2 isoform X1 [Patella vulgata]XP_050401683.1 F-box/WD repeat-containing protein 2 isoform X1 [Patella vulgata]XP_050401684.1 F-box/WD repeat-containing protein 2 isoform X1 [Patella vulgata]